MLPEFPPTFITDKELPGQGYGDGELRYLVEHMETAYYRRVHHTSTEFTALPTFPEQGRQDAYQYSPIITYS